MRLPLLLLLLLLCLATRGDPFTLVVLPDTQYYSAWRPVLFEQQVNWICACANQLDIDFVSHVGDVVEHGSSAQEWLIASYATACLADKQIPFGFTVGNHDDDMVTDQFDYANSKFHSPMDSGIGIHTYQEGHLENNYMDFPARNLLILHLQWHADENVTDWAVSVLNAEEHRNRSAILVSHFVLNDCSNYISTQAYRVLRETCNLKMVLGGHVYHCGGENMRTYSDMCNNDVPIIAQNYQARENGGDSWLRYYEVQDDETFDDFCGYTYNVHRNVYETDRNSHFRFRNGSFERAGCPISRTCTYRYSQGGVFQIHLFLYLLYGTLVTVAVYRILILKG